MGNNEQQRERQAMRIVFLGPPGAGKGTQAAFIAKRCGIPHISTGEMMRQAVAAGTELGKKVGDYLSRGELVPDALMIELIGDRLKQADAANGFLLDGFPRTLEQAQALTLALAELGKPLTHVIELSVPDAVLKERIRNRAAAGSGRNDDTEEVAVRRLDVYWRQTAPVSEYYRGRGELKTVDGVASIDDVQQRIAAILGAP